MDTYAANGASFLAADDMICRWLRAARGRVFEPETSEWVFEVMAGAHGAFVDVGASTGWFAIPLALRGHTVVAYECNARVMGRLLDNCRLNGATIDARPVAVCDAVGTAEFMHNHRLPLTSGGSLEAPSSTDYRVETVQTVTLDSEDLPRPVAMIKVDAEGAEARVLAGAAQLIARDRPYLVLEANTSRHKAALLEWCAAHDYTATVVDERNLLCVPAS